MAKSKKEDGRVQMKVLPLKDIKMPGNIDEIDLEDEMLREIARSLQVYGFNIPIFVNSDLVIKAGMARYMAAKKIGLEKVLVRVV